MQNRLGLCCTTLLINYHVQTHVENAVSRSTVNLSFRRLLSKIYINHKKHQGANNEVNCKEAMY